MSTGVPHGETPGFEGVTVASASGAMTLTAFLVSRLSLGSDKQKGRL